MGTCLSQSLAWLRESNPFTATNNSDFASMDGATLLNNILGTKMFYSVPNRDQSLDEPATTARNCCNYTSAVNSRRRSTRSDRCTLRAVHTVLPCGHLCVCNRCLDSM